MAYEWEKVTVPVRSSGNYYENIAYGNGKWVMTDDAGNIYTELTPGEWQRTRVTDTTRWPFKTTLKFINGRFLYLTNSLEDNDIRVIHSEDGINWQKNVISGRNMDFSDNGWIAYGAGRYVVAADEGTTDYSRPLFYRSSDLAEWEREVVSDSRTEFISPSYIVYGDKFVCLADRGDQVSNITTFRTYNSYYGNGWTVASAPGSGPLGYAFGKYYFIYETGVYQSTNGSSWSRVYTISGNKPSWSDCVTRNGKLYFLGSYWYSSKRVYDRIVYTSDGINFTTEIIDEGVKESFDYGNGEIRIVASDGYGRAYDPEIPGIHHPHPSAGFVDEKEANRFTWSLGGYESGTPQSQSRATYQWQEPNAAAPHTLEVPGAEPSIVIPAGTFPDSTFQWRVKAYNASGVETAWSPWANLTAVDVTPDAPLFLAPDGRNVDGTVPVTFSWQHNVATGSRQSRYDAEYSRDNAAWIPLSSAQTDSDRFTVPENTFTSGPLYWRVRTYNSDGAVGPWASASVTVQAAPAAPVVNVAGDGPRPVVSWQTPDLVSYQVRAGAYDSGERYGAVRRHKIPVYLPDGETAVSVRVCNQYGLWSPWSETVVRIANKPAGTITLRSRSRENGAVLMWEGGAYEKYYVYRDGELIGKTEGGAYTDWLANGLHVYQVRGVTADDYYGMSGEKPERTTATGAAIAALGAFDWIPLRFRVESPPAREGNITPGVVYRRYSGRALPVPEVYHYAERPHRVSYSVDQLADFEKIQALAGKEVVYKDCHGALVIGLLDDISYSGSHGTVDFELSIGEIHREAMTYDP